ncbi:MAG: hypothetical protein JWN86_1678 [Planctomycetota bacterium]|nr:hypothetical protein [Planctomycetota bacterium]
MPVLDHQLSYLLGLLRRREAPGATSTADLADRIENRLADAVRLAGSAQAVAWEWCRWLDTLADDLRAVAPVLGADLEAELDEALDG